MKLFRNIILAALCLSLLIAVFASCNDAEDTVDTSEAVSEGQTTTEKKEETTTERGVWTGNPIEDDEDDKPSDPSDTDGTGSVPSDPSDNEDTGSAPSDDIPEDNGYTGDGVELPGIRP